MDIIMYAKTIQLSFKKHCKLNRFNAPTAVTLTMKQAILTGSGHWISLDRVIGEANFRHFSNRLNKACFGNAFCRFDKRLRTIPILESSAMQRLHYHCVLDRPSSIDDTEFRNLIQNCWNATTWSQRKIDVQFNADDGWLGYITKLRSKPDFASAIDWMNYHNPDC